MRLFNVQKIARSSLTRSQKNSQKNNQNPSVSTEASNFRMLVTIIVSTWQQVKVLRLITIIVTLCQHAVGLLNQTEVNYMEECLEENEEDCLECSRCSTYCDVCGAWYWNEEPCIYH